MLSVYQWLVCALRHAMLCLVFPGSCLYSWELIKYLDVGNSVCVFVDKLVQLCNKASCIGRTEYTSFLCQNLLDLRHCYLSFLVSLSLLPPSHTHSLIHMQLTLTHACTCMHHNAHACTCRCVLTIPLSVSVFLTYVIVT